MKKVLTLKQVPDGYEVIQVKNSLDWDIGAVLTTAYVRDIINLGIAEVIIK